MQCGGRWATRRLHTWRHRALLMPLSSVCVVRTRSYKTLTTADIDHFRSIFGDESSNGIVSEKEDLERYNTDWTRHWKGKSGLVLRPATVQQTAAILQYCHQEKLAVVPQAGNTGLVGGSVAVRDEIVVTTERLNQIHSLDATTGLLKCQAGCVLQELQEYCSSKGHLVPIDLGAKGSCFIGGNVSTAAGGQYFYRYGSMSANVLGLEVVTGTGQVLNLNYSPQPHLKDNTGYKLHQLFIGAEGTLGIVTGVALKCPRLPLSRQASLLACASYSNVLQVLDAAKIALGETLAALEFMDETVIRLVDEQYPVPVKTEDGSFYPYYVLVETHGACAEHDGAKMEAFLEGCMTDGYVTNGVLAQDLSQLQSFWKIRESANPAVAATGYTYKYDISLAISDFEDWNREMQELLSGLNVLQTNWGHVMDGNLHFNVTTPGIFEKDSAVLERLEPALFDAVIRRGGSISAEHGLGQSKNGYLTKIHDDKKIETMRSIKALFDPNHILNPYKFLPANRTATIS